MEGFLMRLFLSGLTSFGSIMYASFGFDSLDVLLVGLPRSGMSNPKLCNSHFLEQELPLTHHNLVISLILFTIVAIYIRKVQNRRMYIMMFGCVTPFIGLLAMSLLPDTPEYKWIKWGLYIMTMPFVFPIFLGWSLSM